MVVSVIRAFTSTLFPYTTLFRSGGQAHHHVIHHDLERSGDVLVKRLELTLFDRATGTAEQLLERRVVHALASVEREVARSEEHTSELQSRLHLVCRHLLEKKKHH